MSRYVLCSLKVITEHGARKVNLENTLDLKSSYLGGKVSFGIQEALSICQVLLHTNPM